MPKSRPNQKNRRAVLFALTVVLLLPVCSACSETGDGESTEADKVSGLVQDVADAASQPDRLNRLFAKGAEPAADRRLEYRKFTYRPAERPSIEGDAAAITVTVRDSMDQDVGQVPWTAVREDGQWKLKDAPLP